GVVGTLAGLLAWIVYLVSGENELLAGLAAWPIVALSAAAVVPLVAWAFTLFDVGRDTPA
ncbi:MAG: hypothetical protein ACRELF_29425, partial [Gemmataceae bacterium]